MSDKPKKPLGTRFLPGLKNVTAPPTQVKISLADTVLVPDVASAMSNAVTIISNELAVLCRKTTQNIRLNPNEAKLVREFVQALVLLSKESREQAKQDDLSNLSNEEIASLALSLTQVKPGVNNKSLPNSSKPKGKEAAPIEGGLTPIKSEHEQELEDLEASRPENQPSRPPMARKITNTYNSSNDNSEDDDNEE